MPAYLLTIELLETDPLVTRKIKVSSESSMYLLHHIIQQVMPWKNSHLYMFTIDGRIIADSRLLDEELGMIEDAKTLMLEDVLTTPGKTVGYEYDFGDNWKHLIRLEEIIHQPQSEALPQILDGSNACPPEDCGGVDGFRDLKEILSNPLHEEFISTVEWIGYTYRVTKFSKPAAEKELSKLNGMIRQYEAGFSE
jgi:hypothetical protein